MDDRENWNSTEDIAFISYDNTFIRHTVLSTYFSFLEEISCHSFA